MKSSVLDNDILQPDFVLKAEGNMGNHMPKLEPNDKGPGTHRTIVSAVTSAPCLSGHPNKEYLVLAFFAGVILTLLLMAFVFLIIKSCRKSGHSRPQTLDPPSDHPAKVSQPLCFLDVEA